MTRYIILVYVRPEGRPGAVFDPSTITVTATDDATALAVAAAVAEERGWETERASIIRREPLKPPPTTSAERKRTFELSQKGKPDVR